MQEYTYEPLQERIFIKDEFYLNGSLKSSTYYFDDDYIVIQNSSGTYNRTNIYQDGILVGYEDFDGKKRYVLPDHEGSAHIVLDENSNVLEENLFSPFAEPLQGVKKNKFSYEAKEYDSLVQDYDFYFRKYIPGIGFGQPDTLIPNIYDPQSLNRFAFERNNPYGNLDKDGHQAEWVLNAVRAGGPWGLIIATLFVTGVAIWLGIGHDPSDKTLRQKELEGQLEEQQRQNEQQIGHEEISQGNVINDANPANKEQTQPKNVIEPAPKPIKVEIEQSHEGLTVAEEDLKKIKPPEGTTIKIESPKIEMKGLQTKGGGLGSGGGSNVIPDPSGRIDRFGNPIYIINPNPSPRPKPKPKPKP